MEEPNYTGLERNKAGKDVALICYLTFIGWIIALLMNSSNKTQLGLFHLRQSLGLMLIAFGIYLLNVPLTSLAYFGWLSSLALNIILVVFWIMGLISAVKAEEKPLPLIGELFQKTFAQLK